MDTHNPENTMQQVLQLKSLKDQALAHLLALKASSGSSDSLMKLTRVVQEMKSQAEGLCLDGVCEYAEDIERLLLSICKGNVTVTKELAAHLHESIINMGKMLDHWLN